MSIHGQYLYINTNGGLVAELVRKGSALLRILIREQAIANATKQRDAARADYILRNKADVEFALHVLGELDGNDKKGFLPDTISDAITDLQNLINRE